MPLPRTRRSQENKFLPITRYKQYVASAEPRNTRNTKRRGSSQLLVLSEKAGDSMPKPDIFHSKEDFHSSTVVHKKLPLSLTTSEDGDFSPVPPSYKSTIVEPTLPVATLKTNKGKYSRTESLFSGKKIVSIPKGRSKPTIDLDEAWKNIKMEQDEKYADEFRDNLLITRCWDIWRQGYLWIIVSGSVFNQACSTD